MLSDASTHNSQLQFVWPTYDGVKYRPSRVLAFGKKERGSRKELDHLSPELCHSRQVRWKVLFGALSAGEGD